MIGTRRGRRIVLAALVGVALALPSAAGAGFAFIEIGDDFFDPDTCESSCEFAWDPNGDGVTEHRHNVREDDRLFRSGDPTKSRANYIITLSAGKYHFYCEKHGSRSGGMDGIARRTPFTMLGDTDPGQSQIVRWSAGVVNIRTDHFDAQFRVNGGRWRDWKTDTAKFAGNFGHNDNPVDVKSFKTYEVRARSQKGLDEDRRSGWSRPFLIDVF